MTKLILVVALLATVVLLQETNSSPTKRNWDNELMKEISTESTTEITTKSTPPPDSTTEKYTEQTIEDEDQDKNDDDKEDFDAEYLDEDDEKDKKMVDKFAKQFKDTNLETAGGENIVEGDIELTPAQAAAFKEGGWDAVVKSEAWKPNHGVWPRFIPYEIVDIEQEQRDALMSSITMFQDATCLHFFARTNEPEYLQFVKPANGGCSSHIGKHGGVQSIKLGPTCLGATPAHEIMHALGRFHEQSRPDRDQYVKINWNNIIIGRGHNFGIQKKADTQHVPYDYGSLMHYDRFAFSKNGLPTIEPVEANAVIGQNDQLSAHDIQQINIRYCPERAVRLVGGDKPYEGRVEVKWNDEWGTVCDDKFGKRDGKVICKYLGYPGLTKSYKKAHFGRGSGPIWFDNMCCKKKGNYGPFSCKMNPIGQHNCHHGEDAGVKCKPNVRLVGKGSSKHEGRVEVYVDGQWGTVCDDNFGEPEANVICRQLGYTKGTAHGGAHFGPGKAKLPILLDDLQCTGDEQQIAHCKARPVGVNDCSHYEDASVICSN